MILYDGLRQPCFGQRQEPPHCNNNSAFRLETSHVIIHMCAECAEKFRSDPDWTITPLTGHDVSEGHPIDAIGLMKDAPWVLEVDGLRREDIQ